MPIDPRMMSQAQMLRGQNPYLANPYTAGTMPMGAPPAAGAPPPQATAPGAMAGGINAGIPATLQPGAANLVAGMPQAQERFSQGQRSGDLADQLRQSALEPVKGRMVGRVYVPASITEGGAKLIQAWVAKRKEDQQKEERRLASEEMSMLRQGFLDALKGGSKTEEMGEE